MHVHRTDAIILLGCLVCLLIPRKSFPRDVPTGVATGAPITMIAESFPRWTGRTFSCSTVPVASNNRFFLRTNSASRLPSGCFAVGDYSTVRKRHWRPLHDFGYAVKAFAGDAFHIYTSPVRINRRSALWLGGILAVGGIIYIHDQEIYDAFKRSQNDPLYKPIRKLGEAFERVGHMGVTNKYYLGALAVGYLTRIEQLIIIPAELLESNWIAGSARTMGNTLIGRRRPFEGQGPYHFEFDGGTSFPSGHASSLFQVANIISHHVQFRPVQIAVFGVAVASSLERLTSDAHWPSDVYAAAIYGWAISSELINRNRQRRLRISPTIPHSNHVPGWALSYRF